MKPLFLIVPVLIVVSCNTSPNIATPKPTRQMAQVSGKSLVSLKRGHQVYQNNCIQCHQQRLPNTASVPEWHQKIITMAQRASLPKEDEIALQLYLDEFTDR